MCNEKDRAFFTRRYEEELKRATEEQDPTLRQLHERWADLYRKRLSGNWPD